ncbi:MAG: DctP family TRAP transporter solute-binding subunit [Gammaproteobacteria bacterium]|nr:DctP family TRAP transporter solute-binding subunit [Gammaproteobacteria bacterium]
MKKNSVRSSNSVGKLASTCLHFLLAIILFGCGGDLGNRPVLIKFTHVTSPVTPKGQTAGLFKKLVDERLPGKVEVEIYPSAQLMSDDDSIEALAFGEVQMIAVSLSKFDRITHEFQVFDLPFLFPDLQAVETFQASTAGKALLDSMTEKGIMGKAFWHNGMKQFGGPRPLKKPADAQGLKFRIMESDVLQAQILQIGGNPQKMAFGEVYQALQTGAVDAQENTWSNIYSSKFYEVQPYITETNHGYLGYLVAVNTYFWEKLPDDVREELDLIIQEVTAWGNQEAEKINREAKGKIIESSSSEVIALDKSQLQVWRQAMQPVWAQFEETIGRELIQTAKGAR